MAGNQLRQPATDPTRFAQLGADGYVVTTAEAFTLFNDTSLRYIAFKPR